MSWTDQALPIIGAVTSVIAGAAIVLERVRSLRVDVDAFRKACQKSNGGQGARLGDLGERMAVVEYQLGVRRRRPGTQGVPLPTEEGESE